MTSNDANGTSPTDQIVTRDGYTYVGQILVRPQKVLGIDVHIPEVLPEQQILHGRGVCTWDNGDQYEGEFKNGDKDGQGIYTWPPRDGRRYEGEWRRDGMSGKGIMWLPDGRVFDGRWAR
jgi:hypothetical protein